MAFAIYRESEQLLSWLASYYRAQAFSYRDKWTPQLYSVVAGTLLGLKVKAVRRETLKRKTMDSVALGLE